jgi:CDP-paratose 2-epimerase
MRILIAGGAGFVGANLAMLFKKYYPTYHLVCLDNLSRNGSALNLPRLQQSGIDFVRGDTRFPNEWQFDESFDCIIDAAAEPSVLAGMDGGLDYLVQTNFNGTVNLLSLAAAHKATFIFLSTSRVYPMHALRGLKLHKEETRFVLDHDQNLQGVNRLGLQEDFTLKGARSLYGATKLASELMVTEFADSFGVRSVINRCGVIAGPWQMGKVDQGFISLWVARHYFQKPLQYIGFGGSGLQVRDVLHIEDLFALIDIEIKEIAKLSGQIFNAGGSHFSSTSLLELTEHCQKITGKSTPVTASAEQRVVDIPWYISSNEKLTAATGWVPKKTMEDIIHDTFQWIVANEDQLKPVLG